MSPEHAMALVLAQGTWLQLQATGAELQAATLRGDVEGATALRQRAHDLLETHLDHNVAIARAAKAAAGL